MEGLVASKALILDMAHDLLQSCLSLQVPHIFTLFHTFHTLLYHTDSHYSHIFTLLKKYSCHEDKIFVAKNMYAFANFKREIEQVDIG